MHKPSPPSQCMPPKNRGVYFLHMYSCGKINATLVFSFLLFLFVNFVA